MIRRRIKATILFEVLLAVESTDVVFAVDPVPSGRADELIRNVRKARPRPEKCPNKMFDIAGLSAYHLVKTSRCGSRWRGNSWSATFTEASCACGFCA